MDADKARSLILIGAGHAHLVAMRLWINTSFKPPKGSILINTSENAWYSGMMPGLLSGSYKLEDCAIPLVPLCQQLGIELIIDEVIAVDAEAKHILTAKGEGYQYELLSINTGSIPLPLQMDELAIAVIPVKPFMTFIENWQKWVDQPQAKHLVILGGGPAAIEVSLAIQKKIPHFRLTLVCNLLLENHPKSLARRVRRLLNDRSIALIENTIVDTVQGQVLMSKDGKICDGDILLLATGAGALTWYSQSGLECDAAGFIKVSNTLQTISQQQVFAAGDAASLTGAMHSGVYAVRQGAILGRNIPALLNNNEALIEYHPQQQVLALLDTADGGALMSYAGLSAHGRLFGLWKRFLDHRFIRLHR